MRGLFLLENLVAMLIITTCIAFATAFLLSAQKMQGFAKKSAKASLVAANYLEFLRAQSISSLPDSGYLPPQTINLGNDVFTLNVQFCPLGSFCNPDTRTVKISVTYRGREYYQFHTVFTSLK